MTLLFFFSSRRRNTRYIGDWSSDVCSSDLEDRRPLGRSPASPTQTPLHTATTARQGLAWSRRCARDAIPNAPRQRWGSRGVDLPSCAANDTQYAQRDRKSVV